MSVTNLDRLLMEIQGVELTTTEATVYLAENGLVATDEYNPSSNVNRRAILSCALSVLEKIANDPNLMRQIKTDDMTISSFADSLQSRIDQLDRKIRTLSTSDEATNSNYFMLFSR